MKREKEERKTLNPCKKEERVSSLSSTLIPEINDFMLSLRRVIVVGVLVSLPLFPPRVSAGHFAGKKPRYVWYTRLSTKVYDAAPFVSRLEDGKKTGFVARIETTIDNVILDDDKLMPRRANYHSTPEISRSIDTSMIDRSKLAAGRCWYWLKLSFDNIWRKF